jgi:hypothetical protein
MTTNAETETAIVPVQDWPITTIDPEKVSALFKANLGDGGITQFDLPRAIMPTGKSLMFAVPTPDDEGHQVQSIEGVIVAQHRHRRYYEAQYNGGGAPPDCISNDLMYGIGKPGGPCATCPHAEWGTARDGEGRGQACAERHVLAIAMKETWLPLFLDLPPTSLKRFRRYAGTLTARCVFLHGCVTGISLISGDNDFGASEAKFSFVNVVPPQLVERFEQLGRDIKPVLVGLAKDIPTDDDNGDQ